MNTSVERPSEDCLPRARRLLFFMALLAIAAAAWNIATLELQSLGQLARPLSYAILPLVLIQMIWQGRNWARFALAGFCLFVLWGNFANFAATRQLMQDGEYAVAAFYVLVFVGHVAIGAAALFASSISELIEYRRAQSDLE